MLRKVTAFFMCFIFLMSLNLPFLQFVSAAKGFSTGARPHCIYIGQYLRVAIDFE